MSALDDRMDCSGVAAAVAGRGFCGPVPVLDPADAARLAACFLHDLPDAGPSLSNWHLRVAWAEELAVDRRLTSLAEAAMGEAVEPWASEIWYKPPGHRRVVPWHQDEVYWPMQGLQTVSVWLALTPSGPANGGLAFVPGTHHHPIAHRPTARPDHWLDHEVHGEVLTAVTPLVPAGSALVFAPRIVHGSAANGSEIPRLAMSFRFTARRDSLSLHDGVHVPVRARARGGHDFLVAWRRATPH